MRGPRIKPIIPNMKIPPIIPTNITAGEMFVFLDTRYERRILSTVDTTMRL